MNRRAAIGILAGAAMTVAHAQSNDYSHYTSPWKTPWDYSGPRGAETWGSLDPAYALCGTGREQSPIDIRDTQKVSLPALRFEYRSAPVGYIINNRYAIRVDYHQTAPAGDWLVVGDRRYQLTQFHFHRPSEETVRGKRYPMVVHLMHKAPDGESLGVAVLVVAGHANPAVAKLWADMPRHEGQTPVPGLELNPAELLPSNLGYYRYQGSVSAPPCTEGVTWIVLKTPIELSAGQIAAFAELFPHDVRPVQPLNGRVVEESN